jgi:pimeloyl-ACP methyl ester carboxylesterase
VGAVPVAQAAAAPGYRATFSAAACPKPNVPGIPQADLGPEFHCGYLTVPQDRAHPAGRQIKVAVARLKAIHPLPSSIPLLYLAGGPGGTGLASAPGLVARGINEHRDIIFIDQRGTLHAKPLLSCGEIDAFTVRALGLPSEAAGTVSLSDKATAACRNRLSAAGDDLAAYNTPENAADVADLRVAMHIPRWDVFGVSYGTDLAMQLERDHPQGVRSLVLDSPVPPQLNLINEFWPNAAAGYNALFQACTAQTACRTAFPHLKATFAATVHRLSSHPLHVQLPATSTSPARTVVIDGYTFANLIVVLSLTPGNYAGMPSLISQVARGDGTLAARTLIGTITPPDLTGYGLTFGVFCREQVAFTTAKQNLAIAQKALPAFPKAVLQFAPQAPYLFNICRIWNAGKASPHVREALHTTIPILLLSGSFDAITPPRFARVAKQASPHSQLVVFPGLGHDVLIASECGRSVVDSFLQHPSKGAATGCLSTVKVPAFTTG